MRYQDYKEIFPAPQGCGIDISIKDDRNGEMTTSYVRKNEVSVGDKVRVTVEGVETFGKVTEIEG